MATKFKLRRDTAATWASANPVLEQGEPAIETDTGKGKVGDGALAWNSLTYSIFPSSLLVLASLVDAKGDLLVGSADNTVAKLSVGTDGYVPVADSAAPSGIAWKRRGWEHIADFSAAGIAASIDLDNIFAVGYRTVIEWDAAIAVSSASLTLQLLAATPSPGTPITGANYNYGGYTALNAQTSAVVGFLTAEGGFGEIHIVKGADVDRTRMFGWTAVGYSTPLPADQGAGHTLAAAYTGVRLASSSGSFITGKFSAWRLKVA